jgi:hypothetical protein
MCGRLLDALKFGNWNRSRTGKMEERHCYRVKLPTAAEARAILGEDRVSKGFVDASDNQERIPAILCGRFGPPCYHCHGVSQSLCDFPLGDQNRTCDRPLCLECAPTVDADKNYCHEHDERGRHMLLFAQPKRVVTAPAPAPKRARPLPKKPAESCRWRVRKGRTNAASHGEVLTSWMPELDARRVATQVGGYVETWDDFVKLWRTLYPLKKR